MSFSVTALQWWCSTLVWENTSTCVFFFPLHLLFPSCTEQNTHMDTHGLFISLRLTLHLGIWEFGFWFSMENFNGESSCVWSIWWESVTLHCQTSQACSARYNICSTSRLWMAFQYGRKGQGEGTHNKAKPQLQGHIISHWVYLTDFLYRCSFLNCYQILQSFWPIAQAKLSNLHNLMSYSIFSFLCVFWSFVR